jgi:hypothetical protein
MRELVHEVKSWEIQIDCTYKCFPCVLSTKDLRACSCEARKPRCEFDTHTHSSDSPTHSTNNQKCEDDEKHDDSDEKKSQSTKPYILSGDWQERERAQKLSISQLVISNEFEFVYTALPVNGMLHSGNHFDSAKCIL